MTLKTSLFNKGVYKSALRRFLWGSVVYFLLLFISTSLVILLSVDETRTYYLPGENFGPLILRTDFFMIPLLIATAVPTVVALLVFRFVHSRKQSVFVHSLPVSRTANYISSLLAGFTLMAAPVVINGIILMIISLCGYSAFFTIGSCFIWIGLNLLVLFMLFAYAAFASMITGNSFAMVALNALLHVFLLIIAGGFSVMSDIFLYGYAGENVIFNFLSRNLPLTWIYTSLTQGNSADWAKYFSFTAMWIHIGIAAVFYILALVIYKLRRLETTEDVAGFKCLNPIFKYLITSLVAIGGFAVFSEMIDENWLLVLLIVVLISLIAYFACEMILKKSLKVWSAYKGYFGFAAVSAVVLYVFAFTSFFGYETFVPDISDVESIAAYNYYYQDEEPWVENASVKDFMIEQHGYLSGQAHTLNRWMYTDEMYDVTHVTIRYKMNNGDIIKRRYPVDYEKNREIMNYLYKNDEYKKKSDEFMTDDIADIYRISINANGQNIVVNSQKLTELFECIKKDRMELGYDETCIEFGSVWGFHVEVEYISKKDRERKALAVLGEINEGDSEETIRYMSCYVNANYINTIEWIKDNGYWGAVSIDASNNMYIYKKPQSRQKLMNESGEATAQYVSSDDKFDAENYIMLSDADRDAMLEYAYTKGVHDLGLVEYYDVYYCQGEPDPKNSIEILMSVAADDMPEFLKKYLN